KPPLVAIGVTVNPSTISAQTETNVATSTKVAELAKSALGTSVPTQELLKHVSADMTQGTQILRITFTASEPTAAARGADAFAQAYLEYRRQQAQDYVDAQTGQANSQLEDLQATIAKLQGKIDHPPAGFDVPAAQSKLSFDKAQAQIISSKLANLQNLTIDPGQVIDPANVPTAPISPRHPFDIALGILLGVGLGVGAALVRERNSDAVRNVNELEGILGVPVLASVPRTRWGTPERAALVVARGLRTPAADAYRRLRTNLLSILEPSNMKTILVTSADRGEGKTTTLVNLGAALAEIGRDVVLVSADLRRPAFQRIFSANGQMGLSQVLTEGVAASEVFQETIPHLRVVHAGSVPREQEPVNLLQREGMRRFLAECVEHADFVLIDSPPILGVPDTLVLAPSVDAILFVTDSWKTRWDDVVQAREQVKRAGGRLVAGSLNRVQVPRRSRRAYGADHQLLSLHPRLFSGRRSLRATLDLGDGGGKKGEEPPRAVDAAATAAENGRTPTGNGSAPAEDGSPALQQGDPAAG
ncbi:MAG TPA: polysaccharide biosynthesis tyrosine autokinase, partial [Actinomycetota bacterium]|nr:polysaccharide biosynthesis tyrosine autokinase [Actinomycetota bacterium]